MNHKFLKALAGENFDTPPVWLMRQAGRYLPEYQKLRKEHSLRDLFYTPKLAAEITLQPIKRFGLDAAILFSDITVIAPALGLKLEFAEGPVVTPLITQDNWSSLKTDLSVFEPIAEAAHLAKQQLTVPLIGFCGGPFTVATYLMENHTEWIANHPETFEIVLNQVCDLCIASLKSQISAGVDAIQIFDSWANSLDEENFIRYALKPLKRIIDAIDRPVILFMRGSSMRAEQLATLNPAAISLDWNRPFSEIRQSVKIPLQGNLDPDLLFKPVSEVRQGVRSLLNEVGRDPGFILNLGHGVKPGTPIESVEALLSEARSFK
jgi:uroporphyrinogen decarboxylase